MPGKIPLRKFRALYYISYLFHLPQRLVKVCDDILSIFDSHAETDQVRLYSRLQKFLVIHLTVGMTGRMQHTASGICHMCYDGYQL